jgi:heterotetrameric sarcosine oxidase gamma subunit
VNAARTVGAVVWRSALEARHAALGARWLADDVRWPASYESQDGGPGTGARLAEIGPLEEWLLRGPGALAVAAELAAGEPGTQAVGRVVAIAPVTGADAWVLGPDEVLLVAPVGRSDLATIAAARASADVSVIEMTGARTTVRVVGNAAPDVLAELCPADTRPVSFPEGRLIQAPIAAVRAFVTRRDVAAEPGYTLMVARDEAAYVWDAIRHVGGPHGLGVVGPVDIAGAAS